MKMNPADLRRVNVFKDATDEDLRLFVEKGLLRSVEEGELFFFQGDPAKYAYALGVVICARARIVFDNQVSWVLCAHLLSTAT